MSNDVQAIEVDEESGQVQEVDETRNNRGDCWNEVMRYEVIDRIARWPVDGDDIVIPRSQEGASNENIDWRRQVFSPSMNDESCSQGFVFPLGANDGFISGCESLTDCWVSASEQHKVNVCIGIERRFRLPDGFQCS